MKVLREAEERVTNIAVEAQGLGKVVQDATGSLTILDDINLAIAAGETAAG